MDIYDPPLEGLLDVTVLGYNTENEQYLVKVADMEAFEVSIEDLSVAPPDDFDGYDEYDFEDSLEG